MATTFQIDNGDIKLNNVTGKPNLIGNLINENNIFQAKNKVSQDIRRGLTLNSIEDGTTAGITELIGSLTTVNGIGVELLLNRQIRSMFSAMVNAQNIRFNIRPDAEKLANISTLQIFLNSGTKTDYRFILGVRTIDGGISEQTGNIG